MLVVDDEPSVRKLYAQALGHGGWDVVVASSAAEARAALATNGPFAAALLDLRMSAEDGLDVLAWMREHRPDVPAAIVTAHPDVVHAVEAMRRGARDFVLKPSRPEALCALVRRLMEERLAEGHASYEQAIDEAIELGRAGEIEAAWRCVRGALARDPGRPEALNLLGVLTELRGDWIAAQAFHRAALALDPRYLPARENLDRLTSFERVGTPSWGAVRGG